ncbi:MAG TPA: VTT domain-containing protein [Candidatus Limnocylindria bacterium]|nr:VTT domain-containing protein [Candidatus Limnocylindria bacterium]
MSPAQPPSRRSLRAPLVGLAVIGAAVLAGHLVRTHLDMDLSPEGIQAAVAKLGWYGPLVFFVLTTFRQFLAIPSWFILAAGGLCFGTLGGTVLGGGALVLSGCLKFGVARWVGRDWVRRHFGQRFLRVERYIDRLGPVVIGLSTAHPFGVLSPFHWGAGLSSIRFAPFVAALVLGAPVRAFAYSAFGAALVEPTSPAFYIASLGFLALVLVPLAFPAIRRRLFARG